MVKYCIGIAGGIGTGKTTLARALSVRLDGRIIPLAAAVKGAAMTLCGVGAFFPQKQAFMSRKVLQAIGHGARRSDNRTWLYIHEVLMSLCDKEVVIVSDVRYRNELEHLKSRFGGENSLFVRLKGDSYLPVDPEVANHPSEHGLDDCDGEFDIELQAGEPVYVLVDAIVRVANWKGWSFSKRNIRVYISSNMYGSTGFESLFEKIASLLASHDIEPLLPDDDYYDWSEAFIADPIRASESLVAFDLRMVYESDAVIAWLQSPSIGAAMEILVASILDKPVFAVVHPDLLSHPFLLAFAKKVIATPNPEAVDERTVVRIIRSIKEMFGIVPSGMVSSNGS